MNDRELIEQLHQIDMTASKRRDYRTLRSILSDDAVLLPPGAPAISGKASLDKMLDPDGRGAPNVEIVDYIFDFEDVTIAGDYAFEWGYIRGKTRDRGSGEAATAEWKVLRVLRKDPAGRWQVHRSMWNSSSRD